MYVPKHFEGLGDSAAFELIKTYSFGTLVTSTAGAMEATHIPFVLDQENRMLRGHVARANPIWKTLKDTYVLVIFSGPDAYISPDWYATPDYVPTWNYQAVHVTGPAGLMPEDMLDSMLTDLSDMQEKQLLPKPMWRIDKLSDKKRVQLRRAIVGFEIDIETLQTKDKLSQDKSAADRQGAVAGLRLRGGDKNLAMAELLAATR